MTDSAIHDAADGPLTVGLVIRQAAGMMRIGYLRVAGVALILFVPPAVLSASLERIVEERLDLLLDVRVLIAIAVSGFFRLFGPVVFAGYLDEAVGTEYFTGRRHRFADVIRSLPWASLLVADLALVTGTTVGLALLVVPGIAVYVCFGLVGPVIVRERRGIVESFGRTLRISRTALVPIVLLVVVPLAAEQVIHEAAYRAAYREAAEVRILVEWLVAAVVGGTVGLLEVALASGLMARNPEPVVRPGRATGPAPRRST